MKKIIVHLRDRSYPIIVGHRILPRLGPILAALKIGSDAVIITNPLVRRLYGPAVLKSLSAHGISVRFYEVPDTERSKSAKVAFGLIEKIAATDVHKRIFFVALGGGVIGDLTGFIASIYKRGVPYVQVPTTFLAQIDSAIGGKVAIDLSIGKNLTGAFYQPKLVFSDVETLRSLNVRQVRNGLAEAIKYGIIKDKRLFDDIARRLCRILRKDTAVLAAIVGACSRIKARVVEQDEHETKGFRTILNFGHTAGHAIEAASAYTRYQHGEAVALGMRVAGMIARELGMFAEKDCVRMEDLLTAAGLPKAARRLDLDRIMAIMTHDKKNISKKNRFVLPQKIGKVTVVEGVPVSVIRGALAQYLS